MSYGGTINCTATTTTGSTDWNFTGTTGDTFVFRFTDPVIPVRDYLGDDEDSNTNYGNCGEYIP